MTQRLYIDVHVVQTVPPANLNRDDQGNPKEATYGGVRRSRVSSQAWKRASRRHFDAQAPEPDRATRTKRITNELSTRISQNTGLDREDAGRIATCLLAQLGLSQGKKAGDTAYLLFYGNAQLDAVAALVTDRATDLAALDEKALAEAVKELPVAESFTTGHPVGVALFGRMVADIPKLNVDAAVQVAHAISTHETQLEFDYFTAVDDQNEQDETGAGMIGTIGFNSATLYRYATVGFAQLTDNLGGDTEAALDALDRFVDSFALSAPTGYQNSFAHRTRPSLVAVIVRTDQPVNLVSAFEEPVAAEAGIQANSARRLAEEHITATQVWGDTPLYGAASHTFTTGEARAKDTAETLTQAFGEPVAFADLRTTLRARITTALGERA
ncbi:type I-E CRISPR-associated protein Cas7/Cse4/CasC [Streptomyces sp. NBC_01387]|uniref:type I-E CRISPR-associated protein Cas7/Cse4/CasC n=1 Tax=unclassified Streptomyces TaxID=2593676 RepID=UPI00225047A1|nr:MULTISPECIES: type I-E CRISPR-associated protein Cas7/Cse4/CasC [unclassified Streptomyces]MCX4551285.1 type I-E CRISPR-associated protein Cas7/Cse4/CasC [Streptomyces sp. NBC_01500]